MTDAIRELVSTADLLAAFLLGQLEGRREIQQHRRRVFEGYAAALGPWARAHGVGLPPDIPNVEHPYHMFYLRLADATARSALAAHLRALEVLAVSHYVPLHLAPMGLTYGYKPGDLPVTERVSGQILRLPLFPSLSEADQQLVCDAILQFAPNSRAS